MRRTCRIVLVTATAVAAAAWSAASASACVLVGFGSAGLGAPGAPAGGPVVAGEAVGFTVTARGEQTSSYLISVNGRQVASGTVSPPGVSGQFAMPNLGPSDQSVTVGAVLSDPESLPMTVTLAYHAPVPAPPRNPSGPPTSTPAPATPVQAPASDSPPAGSPPAASGPDPRTGAGNGRSSHRHAATGAPRKRSAATHRSHPRVSSGTRGGGGPRGDGVATGHVRRPHVTERVHAPLVVSAPASSAPRTAAPVSHRHVAKPVRRRAAAARTRQRPTRRVRAVDRTPLVASAVAATTPAHARRGIATPGRATSSIVLAAILLLVAAGGSAGGLWLRMRGGRPVAPPPSDAVEAELQELISEERARGLGSQPIADRPIETVDSS